MSEYSTGGNDPFSLDSSKMCIDYMIGGYEEYFNDEVITDLAGDYSLVIDGFSAWANNVMMLWSSKQKQSTFHPEH